MTAPAPDGTGPDPARQLLDFVVYAPIGVLTMLQRDLPQVIAAGRSRFDSQITMAKFIGKMAVTQVKSELDRRAADAEAERARRAAAETAPVDQPTSLPEVIIDAVAEEIAEETIAEETIVEEIVEQIAEEEPLIMVSADDGTGPVVPPLVQSIASIGIQVADDLPIPDELPIAGYESLAASQVVLRLGSLTPTELAAIGAYESSHRARRTILGKIHQLQAQ